MTAVVVTTRADVFVGQVLPPERMEQVIGSLPAHVKPERFQRNLVIAITQQPRLIECDPIAVFNEVSKAAALGLYLDPQLGEAYLITGFSQGRYVPQLRLGYRGLIKLARQSGGIATVYAHEVCQNDKFKMTLGTEKRIEHEPDLMSERGEIGLYYAVVRFPDGESDFEPMSIKEVHRIRDRSDGWKAFKSGKIKSTPWQTDEGEMAKKTVLRRLLKRLPQSPEVADALRIDDEDYRDDDMMPARTPLAARLVGPSGQGFSTRHVQIETSQPNSSQADDPTSSAQPATDTPASDVPQVSDAGTNLEQSEVDEKPTDNTAPDLPQGWGLSYAAALRRARQKTSLPKLAGQFWDQYGGWPAHENGPNAETAKAIYNAFDQHFDNREAIEDIIREIT